MTRILCTALLFYIYILIEMLTTGLSGINCIIPIFYLLTKKAQGYLSDQSKSFAQGQLYIEIHQTYKHLLRRRCFFCSLQNHHSIACGLPLAQN